MFDDACEAVDWDKNRRLINDYYKCLRTGIPTESHQFNSTEPL